MALKTITVDLEAYEALSRHKKAGESFSQVIKAHFGRRRTGLGLKQLLEDVRLGEPAIDRIEAVVKPRRKAPKL